MRHGGDCDDGPLDMNIDQRKEAIKKRQSTWDQALHQVSSG
jgi:hypothetical protein